MGWTGFRVDDLSDSESGICEWERILGYLGIMSLFLSRALPGLMF